MSRCGGATQEPTHRLEVIECSRDEETGDDANQFADRGAPVTTIVCHLMELYLVLVDPEDRDSVFDVELPRPLGLLQDGGGTDGAAERSEGGHQDLLVVPVGRGDAGHRHTLLVP